MWIGPDNDRGATYIDTELACRFYGLSLEALTPAQWNTGDAAQAAEALVIDARALPEITLYPTVPVLIAGINSNTPARLLSDWSDRTVTGVLTVASNVPDGHWHTLADTTIGRELSGIRIPLGLQDITCMETPPGSGLQQLAVFEAPDMMRPFLSFARHHNIWMLTQRDETFSDAGPIRFRERGSFAVLAPYMMFLRHVFQARCFHAPADYANLTIDDPWLREPYGPLSYHALLEAMQRARFHTTVAFMPWNYDRDQHEDVVALFTNNPERFSLCVHGNNNDHREFYRYTEQPGNRWPAKPFEEQDFNIRQALARITHLEEHTGLHVDRVMVFPHLIAPAPTLGLLKKYNFTATANAGHVPLDEPLPTNALFWLRRVTGRYEGLASIDRTEPRNRTRADMAIDLFLDNPVLFVEHVPYFTHGMNAFNDTARMVNRLQPDIRWGSLGEIARHLYLVRTTSNDVREVLAWAPWIVLSNSTDRVLHYQLHKIDNGAVPVSRVTVDDTPHDYRIDTQGWIRLAFSIPPRAARSVQISYSNDLRIAEVPLVKKNLRKNMLRRLAEMRDLYMSSGLTGRLIDRLYYKSGLYTLGLKAVLSAGLLLVVFITVVLFTIHRMWRRARSSGGIP